MTTSLEKIIMDEEMISRVFRLAEGLMDFDRDLCLNQIQRVGSGGDYLTEPFTLKHCRRVWRLTVSTTELYETWAKSGAPDLAETVAKKYQAILAAAPESVADPEVLKALRPFLTGH